MVTAINNNVVNHFENLANLQDQAFFEQGMNYFNAKSYVAAWTSFNEAIKLNPNEHIYYYMRAACSSELGLFQASLTDYNKALSLARNNEDKGWVHFDLAILYMRMGDENNAKSHVITAARLGHGMAQNFCKEYGIPY